MLLTRPYVAVFDMDGLVFDTERDAQLIWLAMSQALGFDLTPELLQLLISRNMAECEQIARQKFPEGFPYRKLKETRNKVLPMFLRKYGPRLKPGIVEILSFLREKEAKIAIATSSDLRLSEDLLDMAGIRDQFDLLVCGDDPEVTKGKPDPEIYRVALRRLSARPNQGIAFEDSNPGARAALAAELFTFVVSDLVPVENDVRQHGSVHVSASLFEALGYLRSAMR